MAQRGKGQDHVTDDGNGPEAADVHALSALGTCVHVDLGHGCADGFGHFGGGMQKQVGIGLFDIAV
jgi:hypothetical protein